MVELLGDMPAGTVGLRVSGHVTREDYTGTVVPALESALAQGNGLRTLYLIEDLSSMEPGALWEDAKLGFDLGVRHNHDWTRSAIVTDIEWMAHAMRLFAWMIPGEARLYPRAELEQARAWVAEGPAPT